MNTDHKGQRVSVRRIIKALIVIFVVSVLLCALLAEYHTLKMRWLYSDADNDGIALIDDLDPDRDSMGIFSDHDGDNNGVKNEDQAVAYANSMINTPFDPLMGKYRNVFGRIGMVVCIDVPLRTYLRAGVSFPAALKEAAEKSPEWFDISAGNSPENEFFYRRVRNYSDLFMHKPGLLADANAQKGDWAFYGETHVGLVVSVSRDGSFKVVEADPYPYRVIEISNVEMNKRWGKATFFGRIRY